MKYVEWTYFTCKSGYVKVKMQFHSACDAFYSVFLELKISVPPVEVVQ
jgi:hypothetical protein